MQVRCQRCGFMHTMSRAALETAFAELDENPAKHYNVECPKCRRQIKVPVKQLQRFRPREEES
jgi:DNA-directed RNA polymerase subunit RPC12/RpoP